MEEQLKLRHIPFTWCDVPHHPGDMFILYKGYMVYYDGEYSLYTLHNEDCIEITSLPAIKKIRCNIQLS